MYYPETVNNGYGKDGVKKSVSTTYTVVDLVH